MMITPSGEIYQKVEFALLSEGPFAAIITKYTICLVNAYDLKVFGVKYSSEDPQALSGPKIAEIFEASHVYNVMVDSIKRGLLSSEMYASSWESLRDDIIKKYNNISTDLAEGITFAVLWSLEIEAEELANEMGGTHEDS